VEVRTLRVEYGIKALLPHGVPLIANRKEVIGITVVSARQLPHKEVRATCVVYSMVSSSSTLMTDAIHGSVGLRGMVTLTSHCSMLWA
jgi:hypothetical protein